MKAKDFQWGIDKLSDIDPEPSSYYFPNYDPYMQLHGLEQLIDALMQHSSAKATDIKIKTHTGGYEGPRGGDEYADDCAFSAYFDAFMSSALAAAFAQFLESFIKNEVFRIKKNESDCAKVPDHSRTLNMSNRKGFWTVDKYWCEKQSKIEKGIVAGTIQLFQALGLGPRLPENFNANIAVLFQYRNYVMHNGVEWEEKEKKNFNHILGQTCCDGFEWSKSDGEDNICYLKDSYAKEMLSFSKELYNAFYSD